VFLNQVIKIFLFSVVFVSFLGVTNAQLITDSDRRLKTEKSEGQGRFLFINKKKSAPERSVSAGKQSYKFSETRFSPKSPFSAKVHKAASRFSFARNTVKIKNQKTQPRYSSQGSSSYSLATAPRYSRQSPSSKKYVVVSPRFSPGSPFGARDFVVVPRYSDNNRWTRRDMTASTPRYSEKNRRSRRDIAGGSPRYSDERIWSKKDLATRSPRYSPSAPFKARDLYVAPRYSPGNPFDNINWIVKPDFSTNKHRFEQNKRMKKENAVFNFESGQYKGVRPTRFNKSNSMHPSSAYKSTLAFNFKSEETFRKWNVFWTRLDGNKVQPPSVKEKTDKPKFDRKEIDIWNN